MKTLSIVIPNFNNAAYLRQCLDSVLSQDYPLEEIVVYDDCSTDASRDILAEYAAKHNNIRLILPDENRGVSTARDVAIRSCTSEYVTTLDSDDFFYDDKKLSREMARVNEAAGSICAFSQTVLTDENGTPCGDMTIEDLDKDFRYRTITQKIGVRIARDICFPLDAYIAVGGYVHDMKLFEDWDLSLKLLSKCPFSFSGGYGTCYRQKGSGLSSVSQRRIVAAKIRGFRQGGRYLHYTLRERFGFWSHTLFCAAKSVCLNIIRR